MLIKTLLWEMGTHVTMSYRVGGPCGVQLEMLSYNCLFKNTQFLFLLPSSAEEQQNLVLSVNRWCAWLELSILGTINL